MSSAPSHASSNKQHQARRGVAKQTSNEEKYAAKRQNPVFRVDQAATKAAHKTVVKGLESFRKRKDAKRLQTAKQLRSYQRACKREGYEPGMGASRKRSLNQETNQSDPNANEPDTQTNHTEAPHTKEAAKPSESHSSTRVNDRTKSGPSKPPNAAPWVDRTALLAQERAQQKETALRQRRQRHKLLTARTKKGQPVMKNIVQDILNQLQTRPPTHTNPPADPSNP